MSSLNCKLKKIDETIAVILTLATKKAQGMRKVILFTHKEERQRSIVIHNKMRLRKLKGIVAGSKLLEKRKWKMTEVSANSIQKAEEWVNKSKWL